MRKLIFGIALVVAVGAVGAARAAEPVVIGTGGKTGVYYATGQTICGLLTKAGVACEAPPSGGSVANLKALQAGKVVFAMAQSDWQFHAFRGTSKWDGKAMPNLRAVFSVYAEPMQIVARRDAKIRNFHGLKGKRINIGNPGSGQRQTFELMMDVQHWKPSNFSAVSDLPSSQQVDAFCAGKYDAFAYTVGIPNAAMKHAVADCGGMLVDLERTLVRKMANAARPYYAKVAIPAGTYWKGQKKVDTFGAMATLVTLDGTDPKLVEALVKAVFEKFDAFKAGHPAFAGATPENMVKEGLSAPLHPAALAYYKSKGWVK